MSDSERADGLEKDNPKFGYLIYQFMIGRENRSWKDVLPGTDSPANSSRSKDTHTIERGFGGSYQNQKIMVEYY